MNSEDPIANKARQMAANGRNTPPPSRVPILLSAVFPGLGQFMQQRWIAGSFYILTFLASSLSLLLVAGRQYMDYMRLLADIGRDGQCEPPDLPLASILVPLAIALLAFLASVIDAWLSFQNQQRRWYEQKIERQLARLLPAFILAALFLALLPSTTPAATPASASADAGTEIHRAIRDNRIAQLDQLLEAAPPGAAQIPIKDGITPLHVAAALDRQPMAILLVAYGADVNATNHAGFTPLHWAARQDATNTARLLIQLGADVNAHTPQGITPLHWAAAENRTRMIQLLASAQANLEAKTFDGLTPLDWATQKDAEDAAILIAYEMASRQMDEEIARNDIHFPPARIPSEPIGDAHPPDSADAIPAPVALPRPEPGASLKVPIGHYQTLEFVWIEELKMWFGRYEVTNGQYRRFNAKHDSLFREKETLNEDTQPVVYVSWEEASAFCSWLNRHFSDRIPAHTEFRLPGDSEWVTVARGGDNRRYTWGNDMPPKYGNFSDAAARKRFAAWRGIEGYDDGFSVSCPVDRSGSNEQGIHGLAGNVWEWCGDWFDSEKKHKVRRGGSWDFDTEPNLRLEHRGRDAPGARYDTLGFRVVIAPKP